PRDLHSFPTRRSSDLRASDTQRGRANPVEMETPPRERGLAGMKAFARPPLTACRAPTSAPYRRTGAAPVYYRPSSPARRAASTRSEEHTSELQSRRDL